MREFDFVKGAYEGDFDDPLILIGLSKSGLDPDHIGVHA